MARVFKILQKQKNGKYVEVVKCYADDAYSAAHTYRQLRGFRPYPERLYKLDNGYGDGRKNFRFGDKVNENIQVVEIPPIFLESVIEGEIDPIIDFLRSSNAPEVKNFLTLDADVQTALMIAVINVLEADREEASRNQLSFDLEGKIDKK